jgi:hypothetical protein
LRAGSGRELTGSEVVYGGTTAEMPIRKPGIGRMDSDLVNRALEIIEGLDINDNYENPLGVASLRTIVYQMWKGAAQSSDYHQSILAILERAVLSIELLTAETAEAVREAIVDLSNSVLTASHVETLRSRFIDLDFSSLSLLSQLGDSTEDEVVNDGPEQSK